MIPRYTHPEMGAIWSDRRRYETWLAVDVAAAGAMAEAGLIPAEAAAELRAKAGFEISRIEEIEAVTQHDVIAFTTAVAEKVGPAARYLHFGLTSSDVIDTAQALQMREACGLIVRNISVLMEAVRERAEEHRMTPMIGRTHGVHAEPMSALAITGASLEKFALEIRGLQKTEIGEVEEPFGKGQKGSSAMPHKRNPIGCEQVVGLARLLRANAMAAYENIALWHERDISHSSVERVILPDSFIALDHMLRRFTRIVRGMAVHVERMRENLNRSRGVVFSGTVLLELARKGVSREQAYEWVQRNAMRSSDERRDFKALLLADAELTAVLPPAAIERAFDLNDQLKHVDDIFDRVFQPVPARV